MGNYATVSHKIGNDTVNYSSHRMPSESKQQLWDEIDKQIERSKKMFQ